MKTMKSSTKKILEKGVHNQKRITDQGPPQHQSTNLLPGGLALTAEDVERLIAEAQYQQHPFGKVWQRFDLETFNHLAGNLDRRGLDQEILLYQEMILEGWHRYLACLATKTQPKFTKFEGTNLEAAERVHASGIRRQSTPEQRYASFEMLCDACTEFKKKYEQLRQKGTEQRETGKPLSTGEQRVDVLGTKARAAGFGRSTAAKVEKIKKQKPEFVADIAAGRTTANKVLKKVTSDGVKTKKAENKEKRKKTDRSFSFSSEALIQVRILEPGKFQFTIEDSKNGVINLKMYRKQMAELNTQIEKNLQNDDGFEPAEIPDK